MKKLNLLFALFFLSISSTTFSQVESQTFTQEQLLWFVRNYHPLIQQANLLSSKGENAHSKSQREF